VGKQSSSSTVLLAICAALSVAIAGCASGDGGESDAGPRRDASGGSDAGGMDASMMTMTDAGDDEEDAGEMMSPDAGEDCGGTVCMPFQYCDAGMCRDYPACRGDGTCDRPTDVCHNRRCVPGDRDIDGDGSPAAEDCDETDAERFPANTEECNLVDDDCDDNVDEGDPATLCESYPGGGICIDGSCGCPTGTFDIDRSVAGCECVAMPPITEGLSCDAAIDLGTFADDGSSMAVSGNVMPDDRETWYRFAGADSADTSCDNYHVRVHFTANPDDTFELTVFRGGCDAMTECGDSGFTDYDWATDFRQTVMDRLTGQCPCTGAGAARMNDVSVCADDSADYFVRVRRRAGSALECDPYTIEVSNGLYDTM